MFGHDLTVALHGFQSGAENADKNALHGPCFTPHGAPFWPGMYLFKTGIRTL